MPVFGLRAAGSRAHSDYYKPAHIICGNGEREMTKNYVSPIVERPADQKASAYIFLMKHTSTFYAFLFRDAEHHKVRVWNKATRQGVGVITRLMGLLALSMRAAAIERL